MFEQARRDARADRGAGPEARVRRSRRTCTPTTSPAPGCSSAGCGSAHRAVEGQRRRGRRPLPGRRRIGALRQALAGSARDARPYRRLPDLRARRPLDGLHRRRAADPRLRPHRLPAGRRAPRCYRSVREQVFSLPDDLPALSRRTTTAGSPPPASARRSSTIRASAAPIGEGDFVGYMKNLGLPHPKQMDVAVPANLRCGRPDKEDTTSAADADWAPLSVHLRRHLGTAARLAGGEPRRACRSSTCASRTNSPARWATSRERS